MPEIRLSFTTMGATVKPEPGKLFLDTGNNLCPGIIDHHQLSHETCTALLALQRKELYTEWLAGLPEVEVVLHLQPDIDCIAALYIVDAMLNGKNIGEENLEKLARYALEMDMGRTERPDLERPSLYNLLTARLQIIMDEFACPEEKIPEVLKQVQDDTCHAELVSASDARCREMNTRMAREGLEVVSRFLNLLERREIKEFRLNGDAGDEALFIAERKYLQDDYQRYCSDLGDFNRVTIVQPRIPLLGLNTSEVKKALIYRDPSASLFKLWARHDIFHAGSAEGFTVLLVIWNGGPRKDKRYIMSTDPQGKYCLRFLGDVLNSHEARKREILGKGQEGPNRPGYKLPDPWYDGRAHNYTIVDTPHDGTVLDEEEVISIFTHFITEHIFLETRLHANRIHVVFPMRLSPGITLDTRKVEEAGFGPVPVDRMFIQTFTTSFISLFFSNRFNIRLFSKPLDERKELMVTAGALEERFPVLVESCHLLAYGNILLYSVQLRVEDDRLQTIHEVNRFLYAPDLVQDSPDDWNNAFLLDSLSPLGLEEEYFISKPFIHVDLLLENFHFFREPELVSPVINAFLSGEATSIPSRPHGNVILPWSEYCAVGMNFTHYLSFQNLSDPELSKKSILHIFTVDRVHAFYLYLFVILKKVVLRDLSERFSRLDLMRTDRKTARESRRLEADVLNYINTINLRHITNDCLAREVFLKLHEVNAISESFEEIFTSVQQLNAYHDARMQKKQSTQIDLLQAIFLVGVAASVVSLGAMPGAKIVTSIIREPDGKILWDSALTAFEMSDLINWGLLAVLSGVGIWLLIKLLFLLFKKD
ncbi:MAG: hypothetical protein Q8O92_11610 [Candidatus Latescibacter sp.]|nr:hypothetical protein [Candidatus Latescibacter sp.]